MMPETPLPPGGASGTPQPPGGAGVAPPAEPALPGGSPAPPLLDIGERWREHLPAELREDKTLARYKSLTDLAKGLLETKKFVGGAIRIPGADAKPEEIAEYRAKLGVPAKPEEYGFAPDDRVDPEAVKEWAGVFHELGIPKGAGEQLYSRYLGWEQARRDRMLEGWLEGLGELEAKWGEPQFARRQREAQKAVEQIEGHVPGLKAFLNDSKLGDHPIIFQLFALWGEQLVEDAVIDGASPLAGDRRKQIEAEIDRMLTDKTHPLHNSQHPQNEEARRRLQQLQRELLGRNDKVLFTVG